MMRRRSRAPRGAAWCALLWVWLGCSLARGHEFRPAHLRLQADSSGEVEVDFRPPPVTGMGPTSARLRPVPPPHCHERGPTRWSCGEAGLTGVVSIAGLGTDPVDVVVQVDLPDGTQRHARLGPDRPAVTLGPDAGAHSMPGAASTYFTLGAEHIAGGLDHLLFLCALLLLGGRARDHLRTITAFTVGHALTLVVQSLAPPLAPAAWVEACITASIVVAAAEAQRAQPARAHAWTWALALGMLHGLGFAGALAELGLPAGYQATALVSFNLGVEAGQLAVVLGLLVVAALVPRALPWRERLRRGLALAVGSIAVAWTLERVVGFWSGS
ncbi:MAG: HupE/UreJ family protein [Deltaproteobacteria bacterium]|nr:HupE/UreJ family protein [Deltaproteobacteria bacterium]